MKVTLRVVLSLAVASAALAGLFALMLPPDRAWWVRFVPLFILSMLSGFAALVILRWSIAGPIAQAADWLRKLRLGETRQLPTMLRNSLLGPVAMELRDIARSLTDARAAAEKEAQLRLMGESVWTPEKLKEHVRNQFGDKTLYLVSNREPYMHVYRGKKAECVVPPSGLVTAIEPVMRACGGVWIAQGSGSADREFSDENGRLQVPPNDPSYTLRRLWLTKEEEDGHYNGFSNEGLWPLCHITHARPVFRLEDWTQYQKVNEKFADALLEEIENEDSPLILIQDYHFALLPRLIKQKHPDARIAIFWHIPWPNPESFGICPWREDILQGMLGADIVSFHIQYHCNNFLNTVDSFLESKINWENFSVERGGHVTLVQPFPISVGLPVRHQPETVEETPQALRETLRKNYGIRSRYIGVGVDRLDYTKGILERFKAVERFLEKHPEYLGQMTFIELGAPSRTFIQKYQDFIGEVEKTAAEINVRFGTKDWSPIKLLKAQHSHESIVPFYKAADFCMVTSLHDGMNLVAKEYVSSKEDENGVLILSQFTGASRELKDALIVNPYDIEETAGSIERALSMPAEEVQARMRNMRAVVQERNIYRWAANLVTAIARLPAQKYSGSGSGNGSEVKTAL